MTSGTSGIGRATAIAMAREGARLAIADRAEEDATGTVRLINAAGGQAIAVGGDVSREDHVSEMVARTVAAFRQSIVRSETMRESMHERFARQDSEACMN